MHEWSKDGRAALPYGAFDMQLCERCSNELFLAQTTTLSMPNTTFFSMCLFHSHYFAMSDVLFFRATKRSRIHFHDRVIILITFSEVVCRQCKNGSFARVFVVRFYILDGLLYILITSFISMCKLTGSMNMEQDVVLNIEKVPNSVCTGAEIPYYVYCTIAENDKPNSVLYP